MPRRALRDTAVVIPPGANIDWWCLFFTDIGQQGAAMRRDPSPERVACAHVGRQVRPVPRRLGERVVCAVQLDGDRGKLEGLECFGGFRAFQLLFSN